MALDWSFADYRNNSLSGLKQIVKHNPFFVLTTMRALYNLVSFVPQLERECVAF